MIDIIGRNSAGYIVCIIDGETITVPDDAGNRHRQLIAEWEDAGNIIPEYSSPAPTLSEVDVERDRRIGAGFIFQGALFQSRTEDRENIMGASTAALAAIVSGAQTGDYRWHGGDSDFQWIDAANVMHPMDAQTMFVFGKAAMTHKQAHIFAARAIKDMSPTPADFATNPTYWPTVV